MRRATANQKLRRTSESFGRVRSSRRLKYPLVVAEVWLSEIICLARFKRVIGIKATISSSKFSCSLACQWGHYFWGSQKSCFSEVVIVVLCHSYFWTLPNRLCAVSIQAEFDVAMATKSRCLDSCASCFGVADAFSHKMTPSSLVIRRTLGSPMLITCAVKKWKYFIMNSCIPSKTKLIFGILVRLAPVAMNCGRDESLQKVCQKAEGLFL